MSPLFFREEGSGPPLILIHGFCETHEIWSEFVKPLTSKFSVLTPDLPGFGKSDILPGFFTIDQVADEVAHWITEVGIPPAAVIGHSLGGYITLSVAERYPHLLKGFGLFHSTAFADSQEKKESRNKVMDFVSKHGVPPFLSTFVPGLFFDKLNPAMKTVHGIASQTKEMTLLRYTSAMRDRLDRSSVLRENEFSKLLIAGVEDALVPIQVSREMAQMSQKSSFFELPKVAHMGFFEAKTECQLIITRFTEGLFLNN